MDLCERLDRACKDIKSELEVCESDWGSVVVREGRGKVVSLLRYAEDIGSLNDGRSRWEGLSKYGKSSSYSGSAMLETEFLHSFIQRWLRLWFVFKFK